MLVESFAISSFLRSHDELTAFCVLTLNPRFHPWTAITPTAIASLPDREQQTLMAMNNLTDSGKKIASNLAIVYLASIMEAYVKDVAYELLNNKITDIAWQLIGNPVVTSEDEDIMSGLAVDDAVRDETKPLFWVSKLARGHAKNLLWNNSVKNGVKFLEDYFDIEIQNRELHLQRWSEIKKVRDSIVHSPANAEHQSFLDRAKRRSVVDPVDPEQVKRWMEIVFRFASDIELGIFTKKHGQRLSQDTSEEVRS